MKHVSYLTLGRITPDFMAFALRFGEGKVNFFGSRKHPIGFMLYL